MKKSKSFFKLNKWPINIVIKNNVELQLSRKLEIAKTLFCNYEVPAEDSWSGRNQQVKMCVYEISELYMCANVPSILPL